MGKLKDKIFHVASDLIYSVAALVILNGVIQLVVYPYLTKKMGADSFGTVLYLLSIVSIMASTFGTAANYSRLMSQTKREVSNGDYNIFLGIIYVLSIVVAAVSLLVLNSFTMLSFVSLAILIIVSVARYYGDVDFRLSLNYKGYFVYYTCIALGYIAGLAIYNMTKMWGIVFILGETLSLVYVKAKGTVLDRPVLGRSKCFKQNMKSMIVLSGAELIGAVILNADRVMLRVMLDGTSVTVFYTASIVGKIIALLTVPLNGVLIGYLARYKGKFTAKKFLGITGASALVGLVFTLICTGASFIYVKIMYADVYEMAKPYFLIANAGQIVYFISNTLMVVLLRFTSEKYQLYINIFYAVIFVAIAIPMTYFGGLQGIAAALLIINMLKFVVVAVIGTYFCGKKKSEIPTED